jgi:1-acyl-sn-glycerol-3-phosphate acyltransferase
MNANPLGSVIAAAARLIGGVHVTWAAGLPPARQTVFFANHTSHLDFVILWSSLPRELRARTRPVAAEDYWGRGLRRFVAVNIFNALLVPRHGGHAIREAGARATIDRIVAGMGDGYSLIIFPEGTRGDGEAVGPFKSGLYHLCLRKPELQLVPAYMENLNRILPKGEFLPVPFNGRIVFGVPMLFDPSDSKPIFLGRMRDAVCALKPA